MSRTQHHGNDFVVQKIESNPCLANCLYQMVWFSALALVLLGKALSPGSWITAGVGITPWARITAGTPRTGITACGNISAGFRITSGSVSKLNWTWRKKIGF